MKNLKKHPWLIKLAQRILPDPKNQQELIELLEKSKHNNLIDDDALNMIKGALRVSEAHVRDIMIPKNQMVVIEHSFSPEQALPIIIQAGHSRFPVVGDNKDDILGILLAKDLLQNQNEKSDTQTISEVMRPAPLIPESKRLDTLLNEFRSQRNHMAIVIDEYGSTAGLITIEDVLEEIVGDIEDEYDINSDEPNIRKANNEDTLIKAITPIQEFNTHFKTNFSSENFDTIGGLIAQQFGCIPQLNESIKIKSLVFTVTKTDQRRIMQLKVSPSKNTKKAKN